MRASRSRSSTRRLLRCQRARSLVVARAASCGGICLRGRLRDSRAPTAISTRANRYAYGDGAVAPRPRRRRRRSIRPDTADGADRCAGGVSASPRSAARGADVGRTRFPSASGAGVSDATPNAAAPALFLLADLATDDGRDSDARVRVQRRRAALSDRATSRRSRLFRAAIIAYAAGAYRCGGTRFRRARRAVSAQLLMCRPRGTGPAARASERAIASVRRRNGER